MRVRAACLLGLSLLLAVTSASAQIGRLWSFQDLKAEADLAVIAEHLKTEETGRRTLHPDLKPDLPVKEIRSDFKVLTVLKGALPQAGVAVLSLRHYQIDLDEWRRRQPSRPGEPPPGLVNAGSSLDFGKANGPFLLFLKRTSDGMYEPLSGHAFPTESVFLLSNLDRLPNTTAAPPLPDFSGQWVLVGPGDAPPEAARDLQIIQTSNSIAVVRSPAGTFQSGTFLVGTSGGTVGPASRTTHAVRVLDRTLVIRSSFEPLSPESGMSTARSEEWSVAGDRLTIELSERRDDRLTLDVTVVYRKVRD